MVSSQAVKPLQNEVTTGNISIQEFEQVFKTHFKALHAYAITILRDEMQAEDIVQQAFYKLWEQRDRIQIHLSLKSYLYSSVHNLCLNYIKHRQVKKNYQSHVLHTHRDEDAHAGKRLITRELETRLLKALQQLPEQCRTIFQKSRFEELKYREIAAELNISVKTVENQMGKALKVMRSHLADYLPVLIMMITSFFYKN